MDGWMDFFLLIPPRFRRHALFVLMFFLADAWPNFPAEDAQVLSFFYDPSLEKESSTASHLIFQGMRSLVARAKQGGKRQQRRFCRTRRRNPSDSPACASRRRIGRVPPSRAVVTLPNL